MDFSIRFHVPVPNKRLFRLSILSVISKLSQTNRLFAMPVAVCFIHDPRNVKTNDPTNSFSNWNKLILTS